MDDVTHSEVCFAKLDSYEREERTKGMKNGPPYQSCGLFGKEK